MPIANKLCCTAFLIILTPSLAFAGGETQEKSAWGGQASFSFSDLNGNTNTGRISLGGRVQYQSSEKIKHIVGVKANYGDRGPSRGADRIETRNANFASYLTKYTLNPEQKSAILGYLSYEDDNKAKLESHIMVGVGYEQSLFANDRHELSGSIGAGYLDVNFTDNTEGYSEPAARGALSYKLNITEKLSVSENFVVLHSESNTLQRATTSLDYAITPTFSAALVNEVTHNSFIPETALDKKDDETTLNLVVKF